MTENRATEHGLVHTGGPEVGSYTQAVQSMGLYTQAVQRLLPLWKLPRGEA